MNSLRRSITNSILHRRYYVANEITARSIHNLSKNNVYFVTPTTVNLHPTNIYCDIIRHKSKKNKYESDDEEEEFNDDASLTKDSKVIKFNTSSMRTDLILKSALGVARNKVEQYFYDSKIRVNGKKILKKSFAVRPGDEIDVIKMVSPKNSGHLYVSRVEILNFASSEENIVVTARRFKNLLIENYEIDPVKITSEET